MATIQSIIGNQIFDSRGVPTLEVTVGLDNGAKANGSAPTGAYTGRYEAAQVNDFNKTFHAISSLIAPALKGKDPTKQAEIDQIMIELDGTVDKSNLGGNTILAVSLAAARAAAKSLNLPLYQYLAMLYDPQRINLKIPRAVFNMLNGGTHADNNLQFQEFTVVALAGRTFFEQIVIAHKIFETIKNALKRIGRSTCYGEEGGFAPTLTANEEAIELIVESISAAGFVPRKDVAIGIDVAAGAIQDLMTVTYPHKPLEYYRRLVDAYPISLLEDPFPEDNWDSWVALNKQIGGKVAVVGDDIFSTNLKRLHQGITTGAANAISVKPNQVGTLSETFEAIREARAHNMAVMVSHRAGETEDTFIADLAVAVGADYFKAGAPNRGERIAKYNQILRIEREIAANQDNLKSQI